MNRRTFFSKSALALFGFVVLPPATTYQRVWRAALQPRVILNPDWINAPYELSFHVAESHVNLYIMAINRYPHASPYHAPPS